MAIQLRPGIQMRRLWSRLLKNSSITGCALNPTHQQMRYKYMPSDPDNPIDYKNIGEPNPKYPLRRVGQILKNDFKNLRKGRIHTPEDEIFPYFCDLAIIGGGIIGASIAYFIKQRSGLELDIIVIEKDETYSTSSTALSVGGIRQQFSLPENIQMSMYGYEFLQEAKQLLKVDDMDFPEINFWPNGYLYLASEAGVEILQNNHKTQIELGAKVQLLSQKQLKEKFGWLNLDGIAMGSYGYSREGWFDPHSLLMAFRTKAKSLGVKFVNADVIGFRTRSLGGPTTMAQDDGVIHRIFERLDKITVKLEDLNEIRDIQASTIILAGGAGSGRLGKLAGFGCGTGFLSASLPVEPRKRFVYVVDCPEGPGLSCPLVIDPSGTYFRKDGLGGHYICGKSPSEGEPEPDVSNLDVDYSYFEDVVWPTIAKRVPKFEKLKLKSAYAGFYDYNTFDQNCIIGQHPYFHNMFMATGFSGHGLQQAPAIGRAMMELFIDGYYKTIDLEAFGFLRIINNEPLLETCIV